MPRDCYVDGGPAGGWQQPNIFRQTLWRHNDQVMAYQARISRSIHKTSSTCVQHMGGGGVSLGGVKSRACQFHKCGWRYTVYMYRLQRTPETQQPGIAGVTCQVCSYIANSVVALLVRKLLWSYNWSYHHNVLRRHLLFYTPVSQQENQRTLGTFYFRELWCGRNSSVAHRVVNRCTQQVLWRCFQDVYGRPCVSYQSCYGERSIGNGTTPATTGWDRDSGVLP